MKKISVVALLMFVMLTFAGCWNGEATSDLNITSEKGKGSKKITFTILKDHVAKPDGNGKVDDNSKYFPKGIDAVTSWLKSNVPSGFAINFAENADKYIYTLNYTFNDIAEYNSKTKTLVGNTNWTAYKLSDATISSTQKSGGYDVTFKENGKVLEASIKWAVDGIYKNSDIFDPKAGNPSAEPVTVDTIFKVISLNVKVGDKTTSFKLDDASNPVTSVTAAGTVKAAAAASNKPSTAAPTTNTPAVETTESTNPETGDDITTYVIISLVSLVGIATLAARKKKLN